MKKLTAILMVMLMLVSVMTIGISADGATNPADKLVLHYDFEGANVDEAYINKAYDGFDVSASKTGDLAPLAGATQADIVWDKENGTITNNSIGGDTKISGPVVDRDFARPYMTRKVEYTFAIRAKLATTVVENTGEADVKYQFVDFNNSAACMLRIWFVDKPGEEADYIRVAIANSTEVKAELELRAEVTFEKLQQEWMNIVFVVSDDGTNLIGNLYTSFGTPANASDWTSSQPLTIGTEIARGTSYMFLLANSVTVGGGMLDDVQLYSDSLTLDEIHQSVFAAMADKPEEPGNNLGTPDNNEPEDDNKVDNEPTDTKPTDNNTADTTTDTAESVSDTTDSTVEEKSGCGSTVSMGVLAIVAIAGAAIVSKKRR